MLLTTYDKKNHFKVFTLPPRVTDLSWPKGSKLSAPLLSHNRYISQIFHKHCLWCTQIDAQIFLPSKNYFDSQIKKFENLTFCYINEQFQDLLVSKWRKIQTIGEHEMEGTGTYIPRLKAGYCGEKLWEYGTGLKLWWYVVLWPFGQASPNRFSFKKTLTKWDGLFVSHLRRLGAHVV